MDGRRILGAALALGGLAAVVVGLIGLLDDEGPGGSVAEPSPAATATTGAAPSPTTATETPTTTESPTSEPTTEPAETPEEFFAALAAGFREGDARFLFSRLHPFVLDRYGAGPCRNYLGSLEVPAYELEVLEVGGTDVFVWGTDGLRRKVADATTVRIRFTEDGSTFIETDAHIVQDGELMRWFTDCGTPKAGAA